MYEVHLFVGTKLVGTVLFKSITQVAKFVDTLDYDILKCSIISPRLVYIDPMELRSIWNA